MAILSIKLPIHIHPLSLSFRFHDRCEGCSFRNQGEYYGGYRCNDSDCNRVLFHKECAESPLEINHPSHPEHPLRLTERPPRYECDICGIHHLADVPYFYHCSICDFNVDTSCARKPPPPPTHDFQDLPFVFPKISGIYNCCGVCGHSVVAGKYYYSLPSRDQYAHLECIYHEKKVNLPFHPNHPLELTISKSLPDDAEKACVLCGVRSEIVMYYCLICDFSMCLNCVRSPPPLTAKSLIYVFNVMLWSIEVVLAYRIESVSWGFICPKYVVHSQCATSYNVWDGIELEGIPEEAEDLPFKVVGDNLINHFSHEKHNLRLTNEDIIYDESSRCEACIFPRNSGSIYCCDQCTFFLHEKCAHLPMKRRHLIYNRPFTLHARGKDLQIDWFSCDACGKQSTGFRYISDDLMLDVHCSSVSEPFVHDGHVHPLYYKEEASTKCDSCHKLSYNMLGCDVCDFSLDFCCANLPKTLKHKYDRHPLSLCYGEKASGKYCCDICETEMDPSKWFYTCDDCVVTFHIDCVFGDFSRFIAGSIFETIIYTFEVVPTKDTTRQLCSQCHSRCKTPFILKALSQTEDYCICSFKCLSSYFSKL
ncbi:Cysteine/Histidine-rich C1 domain family protein [Arabidopsis thaliana]|uniref:Cysteine/Histidine-rich C1 domain family protein n=1 Tax=Arabidopsis thaliana TaxID=3702 RepID=F4J6S4_ARATH|nr:Cysteine/Histidine-rich C1 domain family protein [Arabidopsis thaliana]AEE78079.1 Cysteine/Histidine-rich C1 domain family protein [Arabidopsis thaliana]|eukprot:NP_190170.2 Cysteine/Histidine-rich C1 domain family protein [Arabidopsis thaliana]